MLVLIFLQIALFFGLMHCSEEGFLRKRKAMHDASCSAMMATAAEAGEVIEEWSKEEDVPHVVKRKEKSIQQQKQRKDQKGFMKICQKAEISTESAKFLSQESTDRSMKWECSKCSEKIAQCYLWVHFKTKHSDCGFKACCKDCGMFFEKLDDYNNHLRSVKKRLEKERRKEFYSNNGSNIPIPSLSAAAAVSEKDSFSLQQEQEKNLQYLQKEGKIGDLFLCPVEGCNYTCSHSQLLSSHRRKKADANHQITPTDFLRIVNKKYFETEQVKVRKKAADYICVACKCRCTSIEAILSHVKDSKQCFVDKINQN